MFRSKKKGGKTESVSYHMVDEFTADEKSAIRRLQLEDKYPTDLRADYNDRSHIRPNKNKPA